MAAKEGGIGFVDAFVCIILKNKTLGYVGSDYFVTTKYKVCDTIYERGLFQVS